MADKIKERTVYMLCRTDKAEDDGTDVYVGSTSCPLGRRFAVHKQRAGNPSNFKYYGTSKLYERMREVGVQLGKIVPLLTLACGRKIICEFEREWVKALNANLNTFLSINEEKREYMIKYHKKNKETKRYYCELCNIAFMGTGNLKTHLDTYKHFMKWVWDVD